ncbi:MAG: FKBP-type peptidyl-prolyl cis-trans isomerase [Xanthomonadales bacterium]|jgi:FKBP-type peptidyl-prolyl cis-trans isomerase FklB|nr:FKBP-type peptidyl-prolyl cis-trans isomerase [Xanthomonadales bacterium]
MLRNLLLAAVLMMSAVAANAQDADPLADSGKLSYAVGYDLGVNLRRQGLELDLEQVIQAVRDTFNETEPQVPREEMVNILSALQQKMRAEQLERFRQLSEKNQTEADAFLAENAQKSGVVNMPSGVQYRIVEEGEGSRPALTDTVVLHYRGSKINGWEFDSSFARGKPEVFKIESLSIKGWQEVLPLMKEGATWKVYLPPEMAFGQRGNPPIGPNEAVVFDIQLVSIGEPAADGS